MHTVVTVPQDAAIPLAALDRLPRPGSIVGDRYLVLERIGAGGMGAVVAARNLRTGSEVALKYMAIDHDAPLIMRRALQERFAREAHAVGRVRHRNVVDLYEVGKDAGVPYLVMERLRGESLRARLRRGRIPEQELLALAIQAARGVAAAHAQGVIHRDLKPDNLFLAREADGQVTVKVLDFGVSRVLDGGRMRSLTPYGSVVGTPAYMPLEQLCGQSVDERVDIYALGAIMYEALSGARPHAGHTLHDLIKGRSAGAPLPLSEAAPHVSAWLCELVMTCLALDPTQRFGSVSALLHALQAPRVAFSSRKPRGWGRILLCALIPSLR